MSNNDHFSIISTPVIGNETDVFWSREVIDRKGWNAKPVLFLTRNDLNADERELVSKIIGACKLTVEEYNLFELADDEQIAWHLLRDELKVSTIVLFDILPLQLGVSVHFMPHQTNRFDNCNWIPTASPAQMISQPEIKTHLWNYGLKPVFVDKIYN